MQGSIYVPVVYLGLSFNFGAKNKVNFCDFCVSPYHNTITTPLAIVIDLAYILSLHDKRKYNPSPSRILQFQNFVCP